MSTQATSPPHEQQQPQQQQQQAAATSSQPHGRHILSHLETAAAAAEAGAPKPQTQQLLSGGRPILGGSSGAAFPDVAAHEWNVNVADFIPTLAPTGTGSGASGDDGPTQLAAQTLSALRSATDRDQSEARMALALNGLRRGARTRDDPGRLVRAIVQMACADRAVCEPAAGLLAYLAINFTVSEKDCPHLIAEEPGPLSRLPVYLALMRQCSEENDRLCRCLAAQKTATPAQAGYVQLFSLLYACLPSPSAPAERQPAVAKATLRLLTQLAGLSDCPPAFRGVHGALLAVGELLDADCAASAAAVNGSDAEDSAKLLDELYDRLRLAVAHCRVGDASLATEIIRLLELRASGWGRPPPGFVLSASVSNASASQSMTDDMYADYEQFLRESGQL